MNPSSALNIEDDNNEQADNVASTNAMEGTSSSSSLSQKQSFEIKSVPKLATNSGDSSSLVFTSDDDYSSAKVNVNNTIGNSKPPFRASGATTPTSWSRLQRANSSGNRRNKEDDNSSHFLFMSEPSMSEDITDASSHLVRAPHRVAFAQQYYNRSSDNDSYTRISPKPLPRNIYYVARPIPPNSPGGNTSLSSWDSPATSSNRNRKVPNLIPTFNSNNNNNANNNSNNRNGMGNNNAANGNYPMYGPYRNEYSSSSRKNEKNSIQQRSTKRQLKQQVAYTPSSSDSNGNSDSYFHTDDGHESSLSQLLPPDLIVPRQQSYDGVLKDDSKHQPPRTVAEQKQHRRSKSLPLQRQKRYTSFKPFKSKFAPHAFGTTDESIVMTLSESDKDNDGIDEDDDDSSQGHHNINQIDSSEFEGHHSADDERTIERTELPRLPVLVQASTSAIGRKSIGSNVLNTGLPNTTNTPHQLEPIPAAPIFHPPRHKRTRSGDAAAASLATGGADWKGMKLDRIPLPDQWHTDDDDDDEEDDDESDIVKKGKGVLSNIRRLGRENGHQNAAEMRRHSESPGMYRELPYPLRRQQQLLDRQNKSDPLLPKAGSMSKINVMPSNQATLEASQQVGGMNPNLSYAWLPSPSLPRSPYVSLQKHHSSDPQISTQQNIYGGAYANDPRGTFQSSSYGSVGYQSMNQMQPVQEDADELSNDESDDDSNSYYSTSENSQNEQHAHAREGETPESLPKPPPNQGINVSFGSTRSSPRRRNRAIFQPQTSAIKDDPQSYATYICPRCHTVQREFFTVSDAPRQGEGPSGYLALYFFVYVIASLFIFGLEEGWLPLDCIYFAVITLTTAGLGDFVPTTDTNKIICSIFIYFGVACIGLLLGTYIAGILDDKAYRDAKYKQAESCPNCARMKMMNEASRRASLVNTARFSREQRPSSALQSQRRRFQSERMSNVPPPPGAIIFTPVDTTRKRPGQMNRERSAGDRSNSSHKSPRTPNQQNITESGSAFNRSPDANNSQGVGRANESSNNQFLANINELPSKSRKHSVMESPTTRRILGRQNHTRHASMDIGNVNLFNPSMNNPARRFTAVPKLEKPTREETVPLIQEAVPTVSYVEGQSREASSFEAAADDSSTCSSSSGSSYFLLDNMLDDDAYRLKMAKYVFVTLRQALVNSLVIIAVGCLGFWLVEEFSLIDSWYFTTVLLTTVGYGDIVPVTKGGKMFATTYILVAGTILLNNMSLISMIPLELRKRRIERAVLTQFGDELDDDGLKELATGPIIQKLNLSAKRAYGLDECTREMFCLSMLIRLGKVTETDVMDCFAAFKRLDVEETGVLNSGTIIQGLIHKHRKKNKKRGSRVDQPPPPPPPPPFYATTPPMSHNAEVPQIFLYDQNGSIHRVHDNYEMFMNNGETQLPQRPRMQHNFRSERFVVARGSSNESKDLHECPF